DRGAALVTDPRERTEIAALDLRAARRAKLSGSLALALDHARKGLALAPEAGRLRQGLLREGAECAFFAGAHQEGEALFAAALAGAGTVLEAAELHDLRVKAEAARGDQGAALRWGRAGLALLGVELPEAPTAETAAAELAAVHQRLGGRSPRDLLD